MQINKAQIAENGTNTHKSTLPERFNLPHKTELGPLVNRTSWQFHDVFTQITLTPAQILLRKIRTEKSWLERQKCPHN